VQAVHTFFSYLEAFDGFANPFRLLDFPKVDVDPSPKALDPEQCERVLDAAENTLWADEFERARAVGMLAMALYAGLRRSEILRLKVAEVNLEYTRIVAPTDGYLGEKKVRPGQFVSAGTQVVSLVGREVWVIANYKETQMARVKLGDTADVAVDGVPGVAYKGHVANISPATGSQFSLLPPDNATGNFTKIAQRIPVKITIDADQPDLDRLRAGMSVVATIHTAQN